MPPRKQPRKDLDQLAALVASKTNMLIVLQDSPDPDTLAAGIGLKQLAHHWGMAQCCFSCGGVVGRFERPLCTPLGMIRSSR